MSDAAEFVVDPSGGAIPHQGDAEEEAEAGSSSNRDRDLLGGQNKKRDDDLAKLFDDIERGFEDQKPRSDDIERYWEAYNCILNECQYYAGIAEIFFPIIHDAVEARATRFVNQLFPPGGRAIEQTTDGQQHPGLLGLLEYFLREALFETKVAKPLSKHLDIEGHGSLYMDWGEIERQIVSRETHGPRVPLAGQMVEAPGEEIKDIKEEMIVEGRPVFEVLHDCDVLVLPPSADSIDEALANGGSVNIVRRWSKTKIDQMVEQGQIVKRSAKALKDAMAKMEKGDFNQEKKLLEHVGIHAKGQEATIWETWKLLPLDDEGAYTEKGSPRLCRIFFGPDRGALGAKRNPNWNDRCPLISEPVEKVAGVFKGKSKIAHVASLQYEANDAANEGADAATLSAGPIIRYDPETSPGPKVLAIGALWPGKPGSIEFMEFPDLTPRAVTRVQIALQSIFQSLGVNPSMMPQQTRSNKPSQAQVAQDQAVDLLTTAEGVKVLSQSIFTPMLGWMVDLDYQYREDDITVRAFGQMGREAKLEKVAPLQNRTGFSFLWRGAEQVKMMAMMQQQGAQLINIARGMRQELAAEGMQLRLAPVFEAAFQNTFGAVLGSQVLIDQRHQLTTPPDEENEMLLEGFDVHVHPLDQDAEHLKSHMPALQQTGDPHGTIRAHIQAHIMSMQMKNMASMQRQQAQSGGGPQPGGGGGPGQPKPGAVPGQPQLAKRPDGAVHPDRGAASGVIEMPRRN
jgi:hypothetical protein